MKWVFFTTLSTSHEASCQRLESLVHGHSPTNKPSASNWFEPGDLSLAAVVVVVEAVEIVLGWLYWGLTPR